VVALTSVDVASSRSVLGRTVTATTDVGEVAGNVAVNARVQGNIDLVTVPVRVGTTSVTSLSSTSNGNRAARSVAEGDNTIDSLDTDGIQRSATTVVSVTATTARGDTNASTADAGKSFGVGQALSRSDGQDGEDNKGRQYGVLHWRRVVEDR
jgi:hypothetical protein